MQGAAVIEIPGYSILGQIGRGGMATVYRARQILLDREVALKVMSNQLATDPTYAQRFLQEARMLAALNHPHIVQVYDIGETPGGLNYFSMQLLGGGDFAERMRDGMSEEELVRVLVAVAQALGFAHARGYVHRDVTPANILFDAHNQPVLTDFGIARALAATSRITSAGLSIGTSQYMSPEQARGAEVDHRSDIYSLGVLCFEAVAGHPPFQGDDGFAVAFAHVHDPVPRLPEEAARWQPLIDRAMSKDPNDRYADCQAFIDGLRAVAPDEYAANFGATPGRAAPAVLKPGVPAAASGTAAKASQQSAAPRQRRSIPWLPVLLALGAIASGSLLAFGLWSWWQKPARPVAAAAPSPSSTTAPRSTSAGTHTVATAESAPQDAGSGEGEVGESGELVVADANAPPHTVFDPVLELVRMGRFNLQQGRLNTPKPNNAFDRFSLALLIEPQNREANEGIAEVARALLAQAGKVDAATATSQWLDLLSQAEATAQASTVGAAVLKDIAKLKADQLATLRRAGESALQAWDGAAAKAAYASALLIAPGDAAAQRGAARAAKLGKLGYVFEDEAGPQMVVVTDGLALSRSEITVDQFRQFWTARGKGKFASSMPGCRNREASAFGSLFSGKLSWDKPEIKQSGTHPVVCVSYTMAEAYAAWLSESTGQRYRIPKASELQAVQGSPGRCKGNVRDASFAKGFDARAAFDCDDGHAATAPVGSFAASASGLVDTEGNVREWSSDCSGGKCSDRVAVGLSWETDPPTETRKNFPADTGSNTIGIRVAREIPVTGGTP